MAALLLLAFHCLLRTGEGSGDALVVVALPWTKTGARYGAQEIVTIDDPMINGLLFYLRNGVEPEDLVHLVGAMGLRAFFPKAVDFFSLHDLDLRPYSLRRGGAMNRWRTPG